MTKDTNKSDKDNELPNFNLNLHGLSISELSFIMTAMERERNKSKSSVDIADIETLRVGNRVMSKITRQNKDVFKKLAYEHEIFGEEIPYQIQQIIEDDSETENQNIQSDKTKLSEEDNNV